MAWLDVFFFRLLEIIVWICVGISFHAEKKNRQELIFIQLGTTSGNGHTQADAMHRSNCGTILANYPIHSIKLITFQNFIID